MVGWTGKIEGWLDGYKKWMDRQKIWMNGWMDRQKYIDTKMEYWMDKKWMVGWIQNI